MDVPAPLSWEGTDVDTTTLESRLTDLWKKLTAAAPQVHPVRTRIFNLVAFGQDVERADTICACLDSIRHIHPSRTIVVQSERLSPGSGIDASLTLACETVSETVPTCCHERIVLKVRGRAADHLSGVVAPLLLPALPTYLWWPGQPLFGHRVFHRLLDVAEQLLVDSAEFETPGDGLADLANIAAGRHAVNDINWARLTPWREVIAQFFDAADLRPYARAIQSVRLEFGQGPGDNTRATSSVLLMLGWIAAQLGWVPETTLDQSVSGDIGLAALCGERVIPIDLTIRDHGPDAACRLMGLTITAQPAGSEEGIFTVTRSRDLQHLTITTEVARRDPIRRVVPLAVDDERDLVAQELEIVGKDRLYETVVREASRMAGREVWTAA